MNARGTDSLPGVEIQSIYEKRVAPDVFDGHEFESAVGFTLFLLNGSLGFQLADAPLAHATATNCFSPGPDLRDGLLHHVGVTIDRDDPSGGRLFVDGEIVCTFDPTSEPGDLTNGDPLRIVAWFSAVEPLIRVGYDIYNVNNGRWSARAITLLATTDHAGTLLPKTPDALLERLPSC